ncbi:hypothetical protein HXY33_06665 [Candidatus Bathyarchaeota archaeon]|nr:hypothetical protein [Candidatus Bathyarchaeota archaeon]
MSKDNLINVFVGSLITSLVGAVLLLFEDSAGWYNYTYYVQSWGWISFNLDTPLSVALIGIVAALLFYCTYISLQGLRLKGQVNMQTIRYGLIASLAALIIVIVGAIAFIAVMLIDENSEWWFEAGFYSGLLGSGLTALLFYFQHKSMKTIKTGSVSQSI